jgi:hypothetical protein
MTFYEQQKEIPRNSLFTHSYEEKGIEKREQLQFSDTALSADWGLLYTVLTSILWGVVKTLIGLTSY